VAQRRRFHAGRLLVVVVLVLLLALLLELNRFLPGAWPGGGGDRGSRPVASGTTTTPDRVVAGPRVPPPTPAASRVAVVVAPPGGGPPPDGTEIRWGAARATRIPGDAPTAPIEVPADAAADLFEVRTPEAHVLHGVPRAALGCEVRVALPATPVGPRPAAAAHRELRVHDDVGPVRGAEVHWVEGGREAVGQTDDDGRVLLPRGATPLVRVCASSPGHGEACTYANLDAPGPLELTLIRRVPVRTTFVEPGTGTLLRPLTLRLRPRGATPRTLVRDEGFDPLDTSLPTDLVATGHLEVEVPGRPPLAVPLAGLGPRTEVPEGRVMTVTVRDTNGAPIEGARVDARWDAEAVPEPADPFRLAAAATSNARGTATLRVPSDREVSVVADADGRAPAAVRVAPEASATPAITLAPAAGVRVRVRDADGRPAPAARVVVAIRVGDEVVRRHAVTDRDGTATMAGLPAGRLDVQAHVPGHAWSAVAVTAVASAEVDAEVRLVRGHRLHLVVEDPDGVPIAGVAVRSVERPDEAGSPPPPADPDRGAWVTDANGTLVVDDLPPRALDLFLHRDGYVDEAVADVRPGPTLLFATLVPAPR